MVLASMTARGSSAPLQISGPLKNPLFRRLRYETARPSVRNMTGDGKNRDRGRSERALAARISGRFCVLGGASPLGSGGEGNLDGGGDAG